MRQRNQALGTAAICDRYPDALYLPGIHSLSGLGFTRPIARVVIPASAKVTEVNEAILAAIKQSPDKVVFIDTGGRVDAAVLDHSHCLTAVENNCLGFVVNGVLRGDPQHMEGVKTLVLAALGRCPKPWVPSPDELYEDFVELDARDVMRCDHDGLVAITRAQALTIGSSFFRPADPS
jgi:regulator of RNase E activity RraA